MGLDSLMWSMKDGIVGGKGGLSNFVLLDLGFIVLIAEHNDENKTKINKEHRQEINKTAETTEMCNSKLN